MKKGQRAARKRRTRQHVIADLAVNHVERQALLCGYTVERIEHDYGIDLEIQTFRNGEIEAGKILVQVKASEKIRISSNESGNRIAIDRRDLVSWLSEPMPVLVVLYDVRKDLANWLYVQRHFATRKGFNLFAAGKTIAVQIPTVQVVNPASMREFARYRDRMLQQMQELTHEE